MQAGKSMIPCIQWIPKGRWFLTPKIGYAKQNPVTNADLEKQMQDMMTNEELQKHKEKYDQMMADEMVEEDDGMSNFNEFIYF